MTINHSKEYTQSFEGAHKIEIVLKKILRSTGNDTIALVTFKIPTSFNFADLLNGALKVLPMSQEKEVALCMNAQNFFKEEYLYTHDIRTLPDFLNNIENVGRDRPLLSHLLATMEPNMLSEIKNKGLKPIPHRYFSVAGFNEQKRTVDFLIGSKQFLCDGEKFFGLFFSHIMNMEIGATIFADIIPVRDLTPLTNTDLPLLCVCAGTGLSPIRNAILQRGYLNGDAKAFIFCKKNELWIDEIQDLKEDFNTSVFNTSETDAIESLLEQKAYVRTLLVEKNADMLICGVNRKRFEEAIYNNILDSNCFESSESREQHKKNKIYI